MVTMSLLCTGALGKKCQGEGEGGQGGRPGTYQRRHLAGKQRLPQNPGLSGQQAPWSLPRVGDACPGRLLATGTSMSASLARDCLCAGRGFQVGSVEITCSLIRPPRCPWPLLGNRAPFSPSREPGGVAESPRSRKSGKVNSGMKALCALPSPPLPHPSDHPPAGQSTH